MFLDPCAPFVCRCPHVVLPPCPEQTAPPGHWKHYFQSFFFLKTQPTIYIYVCNIYIYIYVYIYMAFLSTQKSTIIHYLMSTEGRIRAYRGRWEVRGSTRPKPPQLAFISYPYSSRIPLLLLFMSYCLFVCFVLFLI